MAMILKPSHLRRLLIAAALAFAALTAPALAQQCASPAEARRAVATGKAMPLSVALQRAGISGQVVRVALCRKNRKSRRAFYRLAVLGHNGILQQVVIPAN
ncbi:MAG TPA: hypothetical protein VLA28_12010 [Afifellaceae bacterium]|nr:hypothetical protein [Afifellaceae bacterium]